MNTEWGPTQRCRKLRTIVKERGVNTEVPEVEVVGMNTSELFVGRLRGEVEVVEGRG